VKHKTLEKHLRKRIFFKRKSGLRQPVKQKFFFADVFVMNVY